MKRLMLMCAAMLLTMSTVTGCTTMQAIAQSSQTEEFELGFQIALAANIRESSDPAAKAKEIRAYIDDVRAWYKGNETATVVTLKQVIVNRAGSPYEKILSARLFDKFMQPAIDKALADGTPAPPAEIVLRVNRFIDLADEVTSFY